MTTSTSKIPSFSAFCDMILGKCEDASAFADAMEAMHKNNPQVQPILEDAIKSVDECDDALEKFSQNLLLSGMNPVALCIAANKLVQGGLQATYTYFTASRKDFEGEVSNAIKELAKIDPDLLVKILGKHTKH